MAVGLRLGRPAEEYARRAIAEENLVAIRIGPDQGHVSTSVLPNWRLS